MSFLVFFFYLGEGGGSLLMGLFWFLVSLSAQMLWWCWGGASQYQVGKGIRYILFCTKAKEYVERKNNPNQAYLFLTLEMPDYNLGTSQLDRVDLLFIKSCNVKTTVDSKLVRHRCKMDKETVPDTASWELLKLQKFSRACLIPLSHPCC